MPKELDILNRFLAKENLRRSGQREAVLRAFLSVERHVAVEAMTRGSTGPTVCRQPI